MCAHAHTRIHITQIQTHTNTYTNSHTHTHTHIKTLEHHIASILVVSRNELRTNGQMDGPTDGLTHRRTDTMDRPTVPLIEARAHV